MPAMLINIVITAMLCTGIALFFILKIKRMQKSIVLSDDRGQPGKDGLELETLSLVARKTDNYVMISDKDDRIEWVNEGFTRLTGYTPEEVIGKNPAEILRGEFTDTEDAVRVDKKAKEKKPYSAEILNYNKKGDPIWMFFNVTPILNEKEDITKYITVGSDITEHKKEEEELKRQKEQIEKKYGKMWETSLAVHKQKEVVENLNAELNEQKEKLDQAYKHLSAKNAKLWRTSLLVNKQKEEVEKIRSELTTKNKDITDSIQYAKIIQQAILPRVSEIQKFLPEMFILYKPKDIVSGDFYWFTEKVGNRQSAVGNKSNSKLIFIAACDCTGHGVPGAFMSMIGNDLLNNAVIDKGITEPASILDRLQVGIRFTLRQDRADSEAQDGMDMALISLTAPLQLPPKGESQRTGTPLIDKTVSHQRGDSPPRPKVGGKGAAVTLQYAGANNPLYIIRKGAKSSEIYKEAIPFGEGLEGAEVKGDKQPVGIYGTVIKPFTNHT
ncbi:MAG TPA: PAS domain-containing protein, partial [bacterium]|nr:PAS domain-containing protein [bacterium]